MPGMRVLVPAAVVAQVADTLTFLALPVGAEANPLVTGLSPEAATFMKAGAVMLAIAAAGEARKQTASATSSGSTRRPAGVLSR